MTTAGYSPLPFPCDVVVIKPNGKFGKTYKFEKRNWCVLGANDDCDIRVPFPDVAQLQALIYVKGNGVFLQGIDKQVPVKLPRIEKQLLDGEEAMLLPGDMFFLGNRKFIVEYNAEDAGIDFDSLTSEGRLENTLNLSRSASKSRPNPAPKSRRTRRKRRKSSLLVGEFDEKYVSPSRNTEKLLSKAQLARLSLNESEVISERNSDDEKKANEYCCSRVRLEDDLSTVGDSSTSSSSPKNAITQGKKQSLSRGIGDAAKDTNVPTEKGTGDQEHADSFQSEKNLSSRKKKDLVFARLSKGLPATPRRGEIKSIDGRSNRSLYPECRVAQIQSSKMTPANKENVPYPPYQGSRGPKSKEKNEDKEQNRIRSPFSNRATQENQLATSLREPGTPPSKGLVQMSENRFLQTPKERSVAFASTIELEAGPHYSPFRSKANVNRNESALRTADHVRSNNAQLQKKSRGRFSRGSPYHKRKHIQVAKGSMQGSAPNLSLERLETSFYPRDSSSDGPQDDFQPSLEYEDDSDPPTPSSTEKLSGNMNESLSGPSPMARVGGALAAFLKRLSGTLESDGDESSSEAAKVSPHKKSPAGDNPGKLSRNTISLSEPVMSSSDLHELSNCLSPERRHDFIEKVKDAAHDMQEAMRAVPSDPNVEDGRAAAYVQSAENRYECSLNHYDSNSTVLHSAKEDRKLPGRSPCADLETTNLEKTLPLGSDLSRHFLALPGDSDPGLQKAGDSGTNLTSSVEGTDLSQQHTSGLHSADSKNNQVFRTTFDAISSPEFRQKECSDDGIDYGKEEEAEADRIMSDLGEVANIAVNENSKLDTVNKTSPRHKVLNGDRSALCENEAESFREGRDQSCAGLASQLSVSEHYLSEQGKTADVSTLSGETGVEAEFTEHSKKLSETHNFNIEEDQVENVQLTTSRETDGIEEKPSQAIAMRRELSRLKKDQLQERLLRRGLDGNGLKRDLVERLALHLGESDTSVKRGQLQTTSDEAEKTEAGLVAQERHSAVRRSARKKRDQASSKPVSAIPSSVPPCETIPESSTEAKSAVEPDLTLYRQRTVKELRQFLKVRGFDIQQKMRKEELIQHLINLSIGSDGQSVISTVEEDEKKPANAKGRQATRQQDGVPTDSHKLHHKMTVSQLRAELRNRSQCQAGTKKILLERLSTQPERRTRSGKTLDATACSSCQAGEVCEAGGKV